MMLLVLDHLRKFGQFYLIIALVLCIFYLRVDVAVCEKDNAINEAAMNVQTVLQKEQGKKVDAASLNAIEYQDQVYQNARMTLSEQVSSECPKAMQWIRDQAQLLN